MKTKFLIHVIPSRLLEILQDKNMLNILRLKLNQKTLFPPFLFSSMALFHFIVLAGWCIQVFPPSA